MHTKNLPVVTISHCPLSSKFTFSKPTPYIRRCLGIIESARITWGYFSDEYTSCCYEIVDGKEVPKKFPPYSTLKLTSARSIQSWYTEHSGLILTSQKTPEAIKKAVQDVRQYARPGIDNDITDKEIIAVFAICEAFDALHKIQRGNSEDAIKERILTASTFSNLAKAGLEPATQDTASKQKSLAPLPVPSGTQWNEVKITFLDQENVEIKIKDKTYRKHYAEIGFKDNKSKNNKPIFLWKFLKELASLSGKFTNCPDKGKDKVKKYFSSLRKTLSLLFNINGDPIPYKKSKDYTGYETAFVIEDKSPNREYEASVRSHHKEYVPPQKKHPSYNDGNENDNKDDDYSLDD